MLIIPLLYYLSKSFLHNVCQEAQHYCESPYKAFFKKQIKYNFEKCLRSRYFLFELVYEV